MNKDLKIIKKYYGEKMMHFCRDVFHRLLEEEGKLSQLLLDHFAPNHELYNDIMHYKSENLFRQYIYSLLEEKEELIDSNNTPRELLNKAGYDFYECKCEEDIQKFKKYYAKGEELCTFNGRRLNHCHVFFAVKKDVDKIKRENFKHPRRQDAYGTSVISIQFTRDDSHTLSIKNRYNHTVENPDATFSNYLDNIIPGLTSSFAKYYDLKQKYINNTFEIFSYVFASDGKYYKYNYEINNNYYCTNNVILNNFEVKHYEKEKYIVMDYFVLDLKNKSIILYDKLVKDSFLDGLQDIKDIKVENKENGKMIYLTPEIGEVIEIEIDKENNIIGYKNNNLISVENYFLNHNTELKKLECDNLKYIESYFLQKNRKLSELNLPNVLNINDMFIMYNNLISKINLPNVKRIGSHFLFNNLNVEKLSLPSITNIEDCFLYENDVLKEFYAPLLKQVGDYFLTKNCDLQIIEMSGLEYIGSNALYNNNSLKTLFLPNVISFGDSFLSLNRSLEKLYAPKLETANFALFNNVSLKKYDLSSLKTASGFLSRHPYINKNKIIKRNERISKKRKIRSKFKRFI